MTFEEFIDSLTKEKMLDIMSEYYVSEGEDGYFTKEDIEKVLDAILTEEAGYNWDEDLRDTISLSFEDDVEDINEEINDNLQKQIEEYIGSYPEEEYKISFTEGRYSDWGKAGRYISDHEYNFILNEDEAEEIASKILRQDIEYEPELFNEWLLEDCFVDERYRRDIYNDIYNWVDEEPEGYSSFLSSDTVFDTLNKKSKSFLSDLYEEIFGDEPEDMTKDDLITEILSAGIDEILKAFSSIDEIPYEWIGEMTEGYMDNIESEGWFSWLKGLGYSGDALYNQIKPYLDEDCIIDKALSLDGWADFLSLYNGDYDTLEHGVVVFREN